MRTRKRRLLSRAAYVAFSLQEAVLATAGDALRVWRLRDGGGGGDGGAAAADAGAKRATAAATAAGAPPPPRVDAACFTLRGVRPAALACVRFRHSFA